MDLTTRLLSDSVTKGGPGSGPHGGSGVATASYAASKSAKKASSQTLVHNNKEAHGDARDAHTEAADLHIQAARESQSPADYASHMRAAKFHTGMSGYHSGKM